VTRLFVTGQLRYGTAQALTRAGSALLQVLGEVRRPQSLVPAEQVKTLLGVYSLLHLRAAVSEGEPPAPSNASDDPLRDALALYASLASQWPLLATPHDVLADAQLAEQVRRYQKRCAEQAGSERLRAMQKRCTEVFSP
jgi:class 3 adenylate cyclase